MVRKYPCRLKIYLLENDLDDNKYAGSTKQQKEKRMDKHKFDYSNGPKTSKLHKHIDEIGWSHFYMTVIDEFDCPDAKYAGEAENTAIQIWGNLNDKLAWVAPDERKEHESKRHKKYARTDVAKERQRKNLKKYRESDHGKAAQRKYTKDTYAKLPWIACDFCDTRWKLSMDGERHKKTTKHLKAVAARDARLAIQAMYI